MALERVIQKSQAALDLKKFMGPIDNLDYNDPVYKVLKKNKRRPCSSHYECIVPMLVRPRVEL